MLCLIFDESKYQANNVIQIFSEIFENVKRGSPENFFASGLPLHSHIRGKIKLT